MRRDSTDRRAYIMAAPQITLYTGTIPIRTQSQTAFNQNTADLLTWWPTTVPEMNTALTYTETKANEAETLATTANNVSNSVVSAANFKGEWPGLTGALTVPSTVYHNGYYWQLLVDIADITASEPTSVNTDWALSAQNAGRVAITTPFTLTQGGRYYVIGSGIVTLPNPSSLPNGFAFDFVRQPNEEPTIFAGTNLINSRLGLDDSVLMDLSQCELIVNSGVYEV